MNISGLEPSLLLKGDLFWIAWDSAGIAVYAAPVAVVTEYLIVQGQLENHGYYDIPENSALAAQIRERVEERQNNW